MTKRVTTTRMGMAEALRDAMRIAMAADPTVFLLGEDIGVPGGFGGGFTVTLGLSDEFGRDRVIDTPISEGAIVGAAVGAAMAGTRPVAEMQYGDFVFCAMDQVVNQAAKMHYMSNGQVRVPMVLRLAGRGLAARRPARAVDRSLVHAYAGPQGRLPCDALRRKGPAPCRHPRRQSGDLPRAQAALWRQGTRARRAPRSRSASTCRRGTTRCRSARSRRSGAGTGRDCSRQHADGAPRAGGGGDGSPQAASGRGHRRPLAWCRSTWRRSNARSARPGGSSSSRRII